MKWLTWRKFTLTRLEVLTLLTVSFAVLSVLTVLELKKQREETLYEGLASNYALLLDKVISQSEAEIHQLNTSKTLSENAQALVENQPWVVRLEDRNGSGDLAWSHVFIEAGSTQPLSLNAALVLSMQEGAARAGRPHYSLSKKLELTPKAKDEPPQIHLAWTLANNEHYGFASWSIPKLLDAVNIESMASLGVKAQWAPQGGLALNQEAPEKLVRLGSTGLMLPLIFITDVKSPFDAWQTYAFPVMVVLLVITLVLLYKETYLRQRAESITREQQERVQANARLATLGEIATMISHEINQPLAAIESYAATCERVLSQRNANDSTLKQGLTGIRSQAERLGRIIRSVQDFAQSRKETTQTVDVMKVIGELAALIDIQAKRFKAIVKVQGETNLSVQTNKTMIEQVVLNLVRNGLEAMHDTPEENRLLTLTVKREKNWLEIVVTDRGCGVTPEIRERLFSPFVTNKTHGTGVGLSSCKSLVEKYRGQISYTDIVSGGSMFTVRLPLDHAYQ